MLASVGDRTITLAHVIGLQFVGNRLRVIKVGLVLLTALMQIIKVGYQLL